MAPTHFRPLALLSFLLLAVTACASLGPASGSAVPPTSEPRSGGILRIGQNAADLGTLDPHFSSGTQDRALVDMVFNGLLRFKPGDATVFEPDLATALPEQRIDAAGKQVWEFNLRGGVLCQPLDGVPSSELT